ncbi:PhoX family protein [Aestuariirhabdus haliotis]|uniref:PhoX family protein n=1 Tax=Aestuariirhabdus haliotis TaxID=2918751 RepID=UPI0020BFA7D7|nr:PhoX family phosphatase [Aestuariirhabdus haliotis]MCL6421479.1 PhoX family phosphatase [Aestuariirhabdus haliotis]
MSRFETQDDQNHPVETTPDFTRMIDRAMSRRQFMVASSVAGLGAFVAAAGVTSGAMKAVASETISGKSTSKKMGFKAVPASTADRIIVPEGYRSQVLVSWGDPLFADAPAFDASGNAHSETQLRQFGDNNDGMSLFPLADDRALLAINNEYTNYEYLFSHQGKLMTADDVKKAQAAHGVSVLEIKRTDGSWQLVQNSRYNRRITANTPMEITGPVSGHPLVQTEMDPEGKVALGTFNNCANGETPWGTYLTCEENFNGYFGTEQSDFVQSADQKRYGIGARDAGYQWHRFDSRFDLARHPQEPHRFGWVVEIDPMDPTSTPKKRTALGRFKHENAALTVNADGHVVVYLGDDQRGEHLYKFVSKGKIDKTNPGANRDLLEQGTLYVARFDSQSDQLNGQGEWLELTHGKNGLTQANGFADQAEVLTFARRAATQVGATTMDRPEWVAVHPSGKSVCCTLTNNKHRGTKGNQPLDGVNPRAKNHYGQIVRWHPSGGDHRSATFDWDLYLLAGNPVVHPDGLYGGSDHINADNMFNSPDGLGFDAEGRLWIQTDGKYSNQGDFAGMGNNQMLCSDPETGEVRRFLTGPVACEITGLAFSPDYRTLFVGVQHPGEELSPSHFPAGGDSKPRSSVMVITRDDGGVIGA